jgi:hypothetical protein
MSNGVYVYFALAMDAQHGSHLVTVVVEQVERNICQNLRPLDTLDSADAVVVPQLLNAQHLAVTNDGGVVDAAVACKLGVGTQESVFPMHGQELLGLYQPDELL